MIRRSFLKIIGSALLAASGLQAKSVVPELHAAVNLAVEPSKTVVVDEFAVLWAQWVRQQEDLIIMGPEPRGILST